MQTSPGMKIANSIQRAFKGAKGASIAMPAAILPYVMRRRQRPSVAAYVLGGIAFAVAGGLVALMFFSPRTRHRALHAAKGTYGKVNEKFNRLRTGRTRGTQEEVPASDGLSAQEFPTTSGL